MKRKRREWRRNMAVVMHLMNDFKNSRNMHPPVCPVIISFLEKHVNEGAARQIPPPIKIGSSVNLCVTFLPKYDGKCSGYSKEQRTDKAVFDFLFKLTGFIIFLIDFS